MANGHVFNHKEAFGQTLAQEGQLFVGNGRVNFGTYRPRRDRIFVNATWAEVWRGQTTTMTGSQTLRSAITKVGLHLASQRNSDRQPVDSA